MTGDHRQAGLRGSAAARAVYFGVLGRHPDNTVCAFNYHNVRHVRDFMRRVGSRLPMGAVVVDVGAGHSPYYPAFLDRAGRYVAVDLAEALPAEEPRKIEQRPGNAEALPLESASADLVLSNQVLEHVEDPMAAVAEAFRVLRPGGVFAGSVPHVSPVHLEPHDYRRFTDLGLERILRDAGFDGVRIESSGGAFRAAALLVCMDLVMTPRHPTRPQGFRHGRALLLAPVVALLNLCGSVLDRLCGDRGRSAANLCWQAVRPER
jgi:SAM-dependent methyltransferase